MQEEALITVSSDKTNALLGFTGLVVAIFMTVFMIIVVYGVDAAIPGVHDTFHDFRHSIGIQCH